MKKIGKFWYNGLGERIYNPSAYFRAIEENKNSYERYNKKKSWEDIADEAEANLIAEAERKHELERHGYSSEEDYEYAYSDSHKDIDVLKKAMKKSYLVNNSISKEII